MKRFLTLLFFFCTVSVYAQTPLDVGRLQKSLKQAQPDYSSFPTKDIPDITIEDSRTVDDPGAGPAFWVKEIRIEGNTIFAHDVLDPIVDVGDGMMLTLGILAVMAQEVSAHYAANGYILAKAYVPEQEVNSGVVRMVVSEGEVGRVEISGKDQNSDTSEKILASFQGIKEEKILREQSLEEVLIRLNELLGVQVRSVLRPGELPGTSDIYLEVTETTPYIVSLDADNFGSPFTGEVRGGASVTRGNLFTLGDQLSLRGVKSDLQQFSLSASYIYPFNNFKSSLKTSYTYSEQTLWGTLASLDAGGDSQTFNAELSHTLRRTRDSQIKVKGGLNINYYYNYLLAKPSSKENINSVYAGISGNLSDGYLGRNFFDLTVTQGLSPSNRNRGLSSRAQGRGNVTVATASLTRYQGVPLLNSYFVLKGMGQIVSARVLSPNSFSIGGMGTVRGYPISEASGDNGFATSAEYFLPFPVDVKIGVKNLALSQVLSLTGYADYGRTYVLTRQAGERDTALAGAGGGLQINIPKLEKYYPSFNFAASYAIPIHGPRPTDGKRRKVYLSGMLTYQW